MNTRFKLFLLLLGISLLLAAGLGVTFAAQSPVPASAPSPLHPPFALLDANGENVLIRGQPISTMKTCGQCHDTDFIVGHSFHSDLGLSSYQPSRETWEAGRGLFGRWDPLTYRYLSQSGDSRLDLGTPEWVMLLGPRLVGGGPATTSRSGRPLTDLAPSLLNPETSLLRNGQVRAWDWSQSGVIEMNCFLCHIPEPNNEERLAAIQNGAFGWANTATLLGSGIVTRSAEGYTYAAEAFDAEGLLKRDFVTLQDPTNANCAQCHGAVQTDFNVPLVLQACTWETATTGQVISPQKIAASGMNIASKAELVRAWDIHAERGLKCTDCHYSLNNPAYYQENAANRPQNLIFDPRRLDLGDYLKQPDHNFARGQSAQYNLASQLKGTMRRCESCHDVQQAHAAWLPYVQTHMSALACESCHIPRMYAPAIEFYDWTVIRSDGRAPNQCRGVEQKGGAAQLAGLNTPLTVSHLVTGFEPALLQRKNTDGSAWLAPYNLITAYFWVYDDPNGPRPVRLLDLQAAYLKDGHYRPEILSTFDSNGNGQLDEEELRLDSPAKQRIVAANLAALGLNHPRLEGLVQPYSINHSVANGQWATHDCQVCHSSTSRLSQAFRLADYVPQGLEPELVKDTNAIFSGHLYTASDGALYYRPAPLRDGLYIFGYSRVGWIDGLGGLFFLAVLLGIAGHGTFRYLSGRKQTQVQKRTERVYMYPAYERLWHWLQAIGIVLLLLTGTMIHRPQALGFIPFRYLVVIHNVIAALLAINAALSLFYHLTTGEIRQYLPRPHGFFEDAIEQARYYLKGIFMGKPHPFEKRPDRKLNPLQQITYFGILNVLLPLQGLSGILMWGVQTWPQAAQTLGGLPFLAALHTLTAWLFAAFIVGHVYLTTTGARPLEALRGMVTGWEAVEVHK